MDKKVRPLNAFRFWGPLPPSEVAAVVEKVLENDSLEDTLRRFALGDIEPRELAYEIQMIFEADELRLKNAAAECDHEWEHA